MHPDGAEDLASSRIERFAKILFLISLLAICGISVIYVNQPILELHGFRQTQTALTAYYLQRDGFRIAYETPFLGEPWSVPFEFPVYQQIMAAISLILKTPLTATGRVVIPFPHQSDLAIEGKVVMDFTGSGLRST